MFEWLLDHGANLERREQDYGSTPLKSAVVMRHKMIVRISVERGADTTQAMETAQRGLAGTTLALTARDIGKSSGCFESLASNSIPSEDMLSGNESRKGNSLRSSRRLPDDNRRY